MSKKYELKKVNSLKNKYVSTGECIIGIDKNTREKYVVIEYRNLYKQTLNALTVEVTQIDKNGNAIYISNFIYKDLEVDKKQDFVPYQKFKVLKECKEIKTKLISATYEKTFVEYKNNYYYKKRLRKEGSEDKKFEMKRISYRKVLIPVLALALIFLGFTIYNVYDSAIVGTTFEDNNYHYTLTSKSEVSLDYYDGLSKRIVIPNRVGIYKVNSIKENAFQDTDIESLKIRATDIQILNNAFSNCTNLKTVEFETVKRIEYNAFSNCTALETMTFKSIENIYNYAFSNCISLTEFSCEDTKTIGYNAFEKCVSLETLNVPNAKVCDGILKEVRNISYLSFNDTDSKTIGNLFITENRNLPTSLTKISIGMNQINKDFFADARNLKEIEFANENVAIEYGSFVTCDLDGYSYTNKYELINDVVISVNKTSELVVNENIKGFYPGSFTKIGNYLETLDIKTDDLTIPANLFDYCSKLQTIKFNETTIFEKGCLKGCTSLKNLYVGIVGDKFMNLYDEEVSSEIEYLEIIGEKSIPRYYFSGVTNIKEININSSITDVRNDAFSGCKELKKLSMIFNRKLSDLGEFRDLETIILYENPEKIQLDSNFFSNLDSIRSITLPENLLSCEKKVIVNCRNLCSIEFPQSIKEFSLPAIGDGCSSLSKVSVPFIGENSSQSTSYSKFNLSYRNTKEVEFSTVFTITDKIFPEEIQNIKRVIIKEGFNGSSAGLLSNCTKLEYLEMNGVHNNCLGQFFTYQSINPSDNNTFVPVSLKTIVINDDTVVTEKYFYDCRNIENIIALGRCTFETDSVSQCKSLRNLYIKVISSNSDFYNGFNSTVYYSSVNVISYNDEAGYRYTNSSIVRTGNVDYFKHYYTIYFNDKTYKYEGAILYDINYYLTSKTNTDCIVNIYSDSGYNRELKEGYFSTTVTKIYTQATKNYTFQGYVVSGIKITLRTDGSIYKQIQASDGQTIKYYIPKKDNYIFNGWYTNRVCTSEYLYDYNTPLTEDIELFAGWTKLNNVQRTISTNEILSLVADGSETYYAIRPFKSGKAIFFTDSKSSDISATLYDSDMHKLAFDDNSGSDQNFRLSYDVEKDSIYYLKISYNTFNRDTFNLIYTSDDISEMQFTISCETKYVESFMNTVKLSSSSKIVVPTNGDAKFIGWFLEENGQGLQITNSSGYLIIDDYELPNYVKIYAYFE